MADTPIPFAPPDLSNSILAGGAQPTNVTTDAMIQPQDAPQAPSFAPPQQSPQHPNHHEVLGRTFNALRGVDTSYSVDANGNTVTTETPQPPGHLFKNILAAALLGGAAGATHPEQGFAGGFVRGGAAEVGEGQRQDLIKRAQAQQQFQNQQRAAQEQREAGAAVTEDQLRKAQIINANFQNVRLQQLIQGESFDMHTKVADRGKQHFSDYQAAGLNPVIKDVPESGMTDMLKNRPGASSFDWEPTGTKTTYGADGTPHFESTFTAYDPKGQVPVSKGTIDQWKKDGMDKYYPELFDILTPGKPLDTTQYLELKRKDAELFNDTQVRQKADLATAEGQAKLKLTNAETAAHLAQAAHSRAETGQIGEAKKASQSLSAAYQDVDDNKGDMSKVRPSTRVIIGESYSKMMPSISAEIRSAEAEGDTAKAKELMTELDGMRHLATQAMAPQAGGAQTGGDFVGADGTAYKGIPSDQVALFLKTHPGAKPASGGPAQPAAPDKPFAERQAEQRQKLGDVVKNTLGNPILNPLLR